MDEIIVRAMRAVASYPRLRMLSLLTQGELTPTQLAKALSLPLCSVSQHLRVLVTANLLMRRKSGGWCLYRAESPYNATTFSGKLAGWLYGLLKNQPTGPEEHLGVAQVRDVSDEPAAALQRVIFEAATAFTDLRRLQLLRYLGRHPSAAAQDLEQALSMSPQALSRHMRKLARRGYVQTQPMGRAMTYKPRKNTKTPIHRRLFEIVRATWAQRSRTLSNPGYCCAPGS